MRRLAPPQRLAGTGSRRVNSSRAVVDSRLVGSEEAHSSGNCRTDIRPAHRSIHTPRRMSMSTEAVDYTVVMVNPMSIRFRRAEVLDQLKAEAGARHVSSSALAEELIEEGLRSRRHPLVIFRDGPTGRRAALAGGPDVWEVIGGVVGGDVPTDVRIERTVELFGLSPQQVNAALDYYASFTTEIDNEITDNLRAADEAEAAWRRRQDLLAG